MHTALKAANRTDKQVRHTVANERTEHDVKAVSSTSGDDVICKSPVTSSDDKCHQQVLPQPPANLPSWIYCTRYTDRPPGELCVRYSTAAVDKQVRSTSLYHCRQCCIILNSRSDRIGYTVVCFMTHDCSRKLRKHSRPTSAS